MITCPNCGKSHYSQGHSTRTAVYYPPIWKDGINVNPDMNITTTYAHCCECHYDFIIKEQGSKIWTELGEYNPPNEPLDINITSVPLENQTQTSTATINIQTNEVVRQKYKWELDIEELREKIDTLAQTVERMMKILDEHQKLA